MYKKDSMKSAKLLLETVKDEYELENEKRKNFDIRGGVFMPLYSALLVFNISSIVSSGITGSKATGIFSLSFYGICFILMVFSVLGVVYAIFRLIRMFNISNYKRICFDELAEEISMEENQFAMLLYYMYENAVSNNRIVNEMKVTCLQQSIIMIKLVIISVMLEYAFVYIIRLAESGGV